MSLRDRLAWLDGLTRRGAALLLIIGFLITGGLILLLAAVGAPGPAWLVPAILFAWLAAHMAEGKRR